MPKPNYLKIVASESEVVDLYSSWREEIRARDWSRVHIAGDRRGSLDLCDRPKRGWR
jgi:hypothetical protein